MPTKKRGGRGLAVLGEGALGVHYSSHPGSHPGNARWL